jgi:diguanylate cyclase (GGDEF)-like protein
LNLPGSSENAPLDFRRTASLGVAVAALILLTPFALNNFSQGRFWLGLGSLLVIGIVAASARSILRGTYRPLLTFSVLVPAIIVFLAMAIRRQEIIGILWCFPAVIAFSIMLPERAAWAASALLVVVAGVQASTLFETAITARIVVTLTAVAVFASIFVRVITIQRQELEALAITDPLTGLENRARLPDTLERLVEQSRRAGTHLTLITIDLDRFKSINDQHGHAAGDAVLRGIGKILLGRIRRADHTFRLGGEEFLIVLTNTAIEDGRSVAESLRKEIESAVLHPEHPVTASMGLATLRAGEDWEELMRRSDENLYVAKSAGRNRIEG